jgi:type I restriction enzyme S subunit
MLVTDKDFIIIWDGASVGEILKGKKGYLSSTIAKLIFNKRSIIQEYFYYFYFELNYILKKIPAGMGIPHLNPTILNQFIIPFPPLKEQVKIANYLNEKTQKIDNITQTISKKIELLKEFRKTLINDVVTGRVKV